MAREITEKTGEHRSPFEKNKRTIDAGTEVWSSRELAGFLGCRDYRNFEGVVEKARLACFNSGYRIEDHFGDVTEMVKIGSGSERSQDGSPFPYPCRTGGPERQGRATGRDGQEEFRLRGSDQADFLNSG